MTPERSAEARAAAERALRLGRWLDAGLRVPGTRLRFGLEAVIGLVPVLGDAAGLLLSLWLIVEAHRAGAPRALLLRMAGNALLDAGAGVVPVIGDLFDFFFSANLRNAELLRQHFEPAEQPPLPRRTGPRVLALLLCAGAAFFWWWLRSAR